MMRHILLALLLCVGPQLRAQQASNLQNAKLYSYGELLRRHNIALTEQSLIAALKNSDADVRYLAAMKLAENKSFDAVPAIRQALVVERVPRDEVNIALALGLLGDESGGAKLRQVCSDNEFIPEFRLYAVRYSQDLHSQDESACLAAAEEIMNTQSANVSDRVTALSLLPRFASLSPKDMQEIEATLRRSLLDSEPTMRMAAGKTIADLGLRSSAQTLSAAVASENDENVRAVLKRDLERLESKPSR
jgi:HEAT repeat protein